MLRRRFAHLLAWPLAALAMPAAVAAASTDYEATPGTAVAVPSFSVKYTGASHTATTYRATPPNEGGHSDLNKASDRSRADWAITFPAGLSLPVCSATDDPCAAVTGVTGAAGKTSVWGDVNHTHRDGLYDQLDSASRCRLKARAVPKTGLDARIDVMHDATAGAWVVTARNPVGSALLRLPSGCREPVDGIDRILANYFMPGFSFLPEFGPDRWFTSASVVVPDAIWRSSARIRLRLGLTAAGRPPKNCGARFKYERCRTSGDWSGVLTFTARPAGA